MIRFAAIPLIGLAVLASVSCSRKTEEKSTKLTIEIPHISPDSKSMNVSQSTGSEGWNTSLVPATFAEVDCFGITVSGPEPEMQRNRCYKPDGSGEFRFGQIIATVGRGQSITLDVPSGNDRVIKVFGMKSSPGIACPNLMGNPQGSVFQQLSRPYHLGERGQISMPPGGDVAVPITVANSIDSSKYFEKCEGPDFNSSGSNAPVAGLKISLQSNLNSYNAGTCIAAKITTIDASGNVTHSQSQTVTLSATAGASFHNTQNDSGSCLSAPISNLSNLSGERVVFVKVPNSAGQNVQLTASSAAGVSTQISFGTLANPASAHHISLFDLHQFKRAGDADMFFKPYECQWAIVQAVDSLERPVLLASGGSFNYTVSPAAMLSLYQTGNCTGSSWSESTPVTFQNASNSILASYKVLGPTLSQISLNAGSNISNNSSIPVSLITPGPASSLEVHTNAFVDYTSKSLPLGVCIPISIRPRDASGNVTVYGTSGTITVTAAFTGGVTGDFYSTSNCISGPTATANVSATVSSPESLTYFKLTAGAGGTVHFTASLSGFSPAVMPEVPAPVEMLTTYLAFPSGKNFIDIGTTGVCNTVDVGLKGSTNQIYYPESAVFLTPTVTQDPTGTVSGYQFHNNDTCSSPAASLSVSATNNRFSYQETPASPGPGPRLFSVSGTNFTTGPQLQVSAGLKAVFAGTTSLASNSCTPSSHSITLTNFYSQTATGFSKNFDMAVSATSTPGTSGAKDSTCSGTLTQASFNATTSFTFSIETFSGSGTGSVTGGSMSGTDATWATDNIMPVNSNYSFP